MSAPGEEFQTGGEGREGPSNPDTKQDDYVSRTGQKQAPVPVQSDEDGVTDPIDPATADSDETLAKDESDAIDQSNIIDERTRGAVKSYQEPGDEEGLGDGTDGRSRVAGGVN